MIVKTYSTRKEDLVSEANQTDDGQAFIVRAILGQIDDNEFIPTGFNDCYDLVNEQMKRKAYGGNS